VFQFAVAVALLVGTLVVHGQVRFLRSATLGFDEAQVLAVRGPGGEDAQRLAFFDALRAEPSVEAVASGSESFPSELLNGWGLTVPGADLPEDAVEESSSRAVYVSAGFFEALGVDFVAGRDFVAGSAADSGGVVLNEAAARRLMAQVPGRYATPEALAGEEVQANGEATPVVGVVRDFHLGSLHGPVQPTGFYITPAATTLLVRVRPGAADQALAAIGRVWPTLYPEAPLDYQFVDAAFDAAYRTEEQLGRLFMVFAGLAILVACLGLFGLAAYAAEQRRKEIGVRKVLGASVAGLVTLLSRDFARLVLIAVAVASPLAYLGMSRWLEGFESHVELGPGPFLVAGALALALAVLTVSSQALRAASADPVTSLRSE
jgi:putative ABC transport system permease protein